MPIQLGQIAVIVVMLTIGTLTNRLGAIRENRPEFGSPEINLRSGGSLETKGHTVKWPPAPRGYKKSVTRLGVTRVRGKIDVVGEMLHWGTKKPFNATNEAKGRD
jgi:hypothetical protein